jgi:hypothetical protein
MHACMYILVLYICNYVDARRQMDFCGQGVMVRVLHNCIEYAIEYSYMFGASKFQSKCPCTYIDRIHVCKARKNTKAPYVTCMQLLHVHYASGYVLVLVWIQNTFSMRCSSAFYSSRLSIMLVRLVYCAIFRCDNFETVCSRFVRVNTETWWLDFEVGMSTLRTERCGPSKKSSLTHYV